ncbi:MAG: hypothetical protein MR415_02920 [Coriobacteriaceae bacterium]|uniref:hypothetical protein n=1 Tax=Tractidigestivibacter sp. TaxID=2847320 RepID=UPI002A81B89C|nr:hypothetical protein [Tractidigestivibacter sp.]MCI6547582.1 hypothetical protein [Coriobacteriaceae bacterium]MCI7438315.1 hypothetical protein [Coriobacteriaceae bacterium]MDD7584264.1 hypothetical protein [Coriobacteriaceae bacterium]MDY4534532.1 hypothetical protein [Tractidigestivibacter sp.]
MTSYATVDEYRTDTGDSASDAARVESMLAQQSAKLRARAGITASTALAEDQLLMCRALVTDACRKALVKPSVDAFGDLTGLTQGTFSANGFSGSFQNANGSGAAYFDRDTLRALMRSLGTTQGAGTVIPSYGRL